MKLYLARHGDYAMDMAQHRDVLTEQGINELQRLVHFLHPLKLHVSHILHSEKYRAQQSAEILSKGFHCDTALQSRKGLAPNDDVKIIANEISNGDEDMLIVGHLPYMGRLVSGLLCNSDSYNLIEFKTGTLVCLEQLEQMSWIINWILIPDLFK